MNLERLSSESYQSWDDFVSVSPQGSIFSTASYLKANNRDFQIKVIEEKGEILAGVVLAKDQLRGFGNPLFTKYLGPLLAPCPKDMKPQNHMRRSVELLSTLAEDSANHKTFDYTFHPELLNWLPYYWQGFQCTVRYTYRFDTSLGLEALSARLQSRLRTLIRKSEKSGVVIDENVSPIDFFEIGQRSFQRQGGGAPYSLSWLKNLHEQLTPREEIALLGARDKDGMLLAVVGLLMDNRYSYLLLNGYDHHSSGAMANSFLVWKAIEFTQAKGLNFDFEGSMLPGVEGFYRKFGADLTPYYRVWKPGCYNTAKHLGIRCYKALKWGK